MDLVAKMGQMWTDLFTESRQVDRSLTDVKKTFTVVRYQTNATQSAYTKNNGQSSLTILFPISLHYTQRLQRRGLKSLGRSFLSLLKASTCMVLELWEMIWRKVLVHMHSILRCYTQNIITWH